MATVTIFTGLCGSGKTYESKELERRYKSHGENVERFEEILGRKEIDFPRIVQELKSGTDCIVEEAFYCVRVFRVEFIDVLNEQVPEANVKWECFENNLEVANANVEFWTNEIISTEQGKEINRLREINQRLSENFECPEGCTPKPIHRRTT